MARREKEKKKKKEKRIRKWEGILVEESRREKIVLFCGLLIICATLTFLQLGFVGLGFNGDYDGYVLALLGPISLCSFFLGRRKGLLFGFLAGLVLLAHAMLQPLDLFESYYVSLLNSLAIYSFSGYTLGWFFAIALHNNPTGKRRIIYLAIACLLFSVIVSCVFTINLVIHLLAVSLSLYVRTSELAQDSFLSMQAMGSINLQIILDFLLMYGVVFVSDFFVRRYRRMRHELDVRITFRSQLFAALLLAFLAVSSISFAVITETSKSAAGKDMADEIDFVGEQLLNKVDFAMRTFETEEFFELDDTIINLILDQMGIQSIIDGYDLGDGTLVVISKDEIAYSDSPAFKEGDSTKDAFGLEASLMIPEIAESGELYKILYHTAPRVRVGDIDILDTEEGQDIEIGYMLAKKFGDFYVVMARPASMVFANRSQTMLWTTLLAGVLILVAYVLAARLLGKVVVEPINRTNASLALITQGNLNEHVSEENTVEFASLSQGINETVDALKGWINEAETRMERELTTAKAIQESALPRTFPPFPELEAFDIFASMDAAKEVGGDFYDFFLIDDHTLGFLIADVSGKGIPGALFMMAAKTEIENYLADGTEPADAIASANQRLCANNDAGMFVTVWAATLDWITGELTYVNAGHNPPLLRHADTHEWEWLTKRCGLFLGTFDTAKYRQEKLTLVPGDELLLYTDGVNEAFSVDEKEYGNARLEAFLANHADLHPEDLVRSLRADVASWAEGAEQSDDVTMLALEYGVAPKVEGSITVPATLDYFSQVMGLIDGELERRLCPVSVQHKLEIALEELFVNVCNYAYADQEEPGEVSVSYIYRGEPRSLTVELRDQGVPFDPLTRKDPTMPTSIQEAKIGGLGIFMVKKYMDDFAYMRDGDSNVVVIKKGW